MTPTFLHLTLEVIFQISYFQQKNHKCSVQMLGQFFFKNKLGSNKSEIYNSARNGEKKFGGLWRFSAVAAVLPPFLRSSLINIIKVTAIPKLTAVTHFLAEFLR